ncbi:hypothetical protein [Coprothermobacter platensis]|uniref:hypothetical protein n=1 Tax=Coprothermobacter platensis TaxID=108819 RepID=UPI00037486A2|nr:hypothetical protein [Coprothermobacter platensis]
MALYVYKGYLIVVANTFKTNRFVIAAFKNGKPIEPMFITPYHEKLQRRKLLSHDQAGNRMNTYLVEKPLQIIVPKSP